MLLFLFYCTKLNDSQFENRDEFLTCFSSPSRAIEWVLSYGTLNNPIIYASTSIKRCLLPFFPSNYRLEKGFFITRRSIALNPIPHSLAYCNVHGNTWLILWWQFMHKHFPFRPLSSYNFLSAFALESSKNKKKRWLIYNTIISDRFQLRQDGHGWHDGQRTQPDGQYDVSSVSPSLPFAWCLWEVTYEENQINTTHNS